MRRHPAPTFVFADLVGYTALTELRGDEAAANLAREFRRSMCALAREQGSWQVKSMGDGVMIWSPDPAAAVTLAGRAVEEVGTRSDLLPVRVGVHTGPAVMRGCDWYGSSGRRGAPCGRGRAQRGARQRRDARGHARRTCACAGRPTRARAARR
jgi:class 3 adenylate cyclase